MFVKCVSISVQSSLQCLVQTLRCCLPEFFQANRKWPASSGFLRLNMSAITKCCLLFCLALSRKYEAKARDKRRQNFVKCFPDYLRAEICQTQKILPDSEKSYAELLFCCCWNPLVCLKYLLLFTYIAYVIFILFCVSASFSSYCWLVILRYTVRLQVIYFAVPLAAVYFFIVRSQVIGSRVRDLCDCACAKKNIFY